MVTKNILRCSVCGFEILTQAFSRDCAKCNASMILIRKEEITNKRREGKR